MKLTIVIGFVSIKCLKFTMEKICGQNDWRINFLGIQKSGPKLLLLHVWNCLWIFLCFSLHHYSLHAGIGDHVQCFYCDGGLKNWERDDVPWAEHARWFGNCAFLKLKKGIGFVSWVKNLQTPVTKQAILDKLEETRWWFYTGNLFLN